MKKAIILVGLPATGKSTWRNAEEYENVTMISSDDLIEKEAEAVGKTYDEVFEDNIKWTDKAAKINYETALRKGDDAIVVDRTNMSIKSRSYFVSKAKEYGYQLIAVVFKKPETREEYNQWHDRLMGRKGKTIPDYVINGMLRSYERPSAAEGFDLVVDYSSWD